VETKLKAACKKGDVLLVREILFEGRGELNVNATRVSERTHLVLSADDSRSTAGTHFPSVSCRPQVLVNPRKNAEQIWRECGASAVRMRCKCGANVVRVWSKIWSECGAKSVGRTRCKRHPSQWRRRGAPFAAHAHGGSQCLRTTLAFGCGCV
jgi:hypothetical protein